MGMWMEMWLQRRLRVVELRAVVSLRLNGYGGGASVRRSVLPMKMRRAVLLRPLRVGAFRGRRVRDLALMR